MRRAIIILMFAFAAPPVAAEKPWLSTDDFEAKVAGKATQVFYSDGTPFGTEFFLKDRTIIWQYAGDKSCLLGMWSPQKEAICYTYENGDENCLRYYDDGRKLTGVEWDDGAPSGETFLLRVTPARAPACGTS